MFRVSRFGELLKHLPRAAFDRSVQAQQADKHRKRFRCWDQLISMLYAQFSGASSLRVLQHSFNAHPAHHYHLGCTPVHRSTLAEANERCQWQVFSHLAQALMQQVQGGIRRQGWEFLRLIDSTSITLKGPGFDGWTAGSRTRNTQGLKLHVLYGVSEQAPLGYQFSSANVNDLHYAQQVSIEPGMIYVFDKAYCDYGWWWRMQRSGAKFVTRFKRNARLELISERRIPRGAQGVILKDQLVHLSNQHPGGGRRNPYATALRRIEVMGENQRTLVLASNDLKSSALKIAECYRKRWQIELFFKWIKQHLRIKSFLGRSENAVRIQILTALIAYLLTALHARANNLNKSLWLHFSELRATLFQRTQTDLHRHRQWRKARALFELKQGSLFV
jgi:putative transposase